ncbi:MAG: YiiX/YebB-like N1pC/P60 family cysteine hydrolase [Candidatus Krumholzibacteriia bacterium]
MFHWLARACGRRLAAFLNRPVARYERFAVKDEAVLGATLRPGDVLLVEGDRRVSTAIKYFTQSTWSHAALYVGDALRARDGGTGALIEVDLEHGVIGVPLAKYADFNTRICRPVGLSLEDKQRVIDFVLANLGHKYDMRNVVDLLRYLFPRPPVPSYYRRRMLAFGSGDPTRAICSTLIAQAFQLVKYPILPRRGYQCAGDPSEVTDDEILRARHYSHFTPRDFDVSPYFSVVKPTIEHGFDYKQLKWEIRPGEEPGDDTA